MSESRVAAVVETEIPGESRLDRWKRKLLDLSFRNRLLNFRDTAKTLPLLAPDLGTLEDLLAQGEVLRIVNQRKLAKVQGEEQHPTLHDFAPRLPIPQQKDQRCPVRDHLAQDQHLSEYLADQLKAKLLVAEVGDEDRLDTRLKAIYREARTSVEETGANTLYLALGFLHYFETPGSTTLRRAPILLLPLTLTRRSLKEGFRIRLSDDDPRINVTLIEKLKRDFEINTDGLEELPVDEHGLDVSEIFERFGKAIAGNPHWRIQSDLRIGLFSFTKFLMWRDLQDYADKLLERPLIRHLVETPTAPFQPGQPFPKLEELDACPPEDVYCPMDADSSQLGAVMAARDGRTFVLQGPPGTGKSQTITNLIAQCMAEGKRVLFVAEKRAALEVVQRRLARIGVGPFCLELHSRKANKKDVLAQLGQALDAAHTHAPKDWQRVTAKLAAARKEINGYVDAIHGSHPLDKSVYQVTSRLIALRDTPRFAIELEGIEGTTRDDLDVMQDWCETASSAAQMVAPLAGHPLRDVRQQQWRSALPDEIKAAIAALRQKLDQSRHALTELAPLLGLDPQITTSIAVKELQFLHDLCGALGSTPGPTAALLSEPGWTDLKVKLQALIDEVAACAALRAKLTTHLKESVLEEDLLSLSTTWRMGQSGFFLIAWMRRRKVRKALEPHASGALPEGEQLSALLELALDLKTRAHALAEHPDGLRFFGRAWEAGKADAATLGAHLVFSSNFRALFGRLAPGSALTEIRERATALASDSRDEIAGQGTGSRLLATTVETAAALKAAYAELSTLLELEKPEDLESQKVFTYYSALTERLESGLPKLREWVLWQKEWHRGQWLKLGSLIDAMERGEVEISALQPTFERSFFETWLNAVSDANPVLREFVGSDHERKIQQFQRLDQQYLELAREELYARMASAVPQPSSAPVSENSEVGILKRELAKKRKHKPIRQLIGALPNLLPRIKPCFLMSPLSVAQYLDPEFPPFDVVVFDEASQVTVWDAIGSIARGKSTVVVGDSRQLPPTSFFDRVDDDDEADDEEAVAELESILDECATCLENLDLRWHYRSRHEHLITFSNHHYYDNRLFTFPSAANKDEHLGVELDYLPDAVYDKGKSRTNRVEAEAVADEVIRLLRDDVDAERTPRTIGVVTLSMVQRTLIEDLLEVRLRDNSDLEVYFNEEAEEPVFVKNLENVQGDERDVILFSICYGPDAAGKVSMNFGPLNNQGGERRLNVAVTRAREQIKVFTAMKSEKIDLNRTQAAGARHLKNFLHYAEIGPDALVTEAVADADARLESPFERDVFRALGERGWQVDTQVGCSGYRIDLAVKDPDAPGRYALGIECDGANYHSAKSARDRDRIRQSVLEGLGWTLHRVWSSDWWRNPEGELEKIDEAIDKAIKAAKRKPKKPKKQRKESDNASNESPKDDSTQSTVGGTGIPACAEQPGDEADTSAPDGPQRYIESSTPGELGTVESFYEKKSDKLIADLLRDIAATEAPVAWDVVCKKIASAFQFSRTTHKVEERILSLIDSVAPTKRPRLVDGFLWLPKQDPASYQGFRVPPDRDSRRQPAALPLEELANAAAQILKGSISLPADDLAREVAKLFGFASAGSQVRERIDQAVALLASRGGCIVEEGTVRLGE